MLPMQPLAVQCEVVPRLIPLSGGPNEVLAMTVLRLLHNLSFDLKLREQMVRGGLIPQVPLQLTRTTFSICSF